MNLSDLPEPYRTQAKEQLEKVSNRNSGSVADRKSGVTVAKKLPVEIHEDKRFDKPVRVHFHSIRRGKPDLDNLQGKSTLDAIVNCGVLPDDGPEWIPERPRHTIEYGKEEKTIITIEEV